MFSARNGARVRLALAILAVIATAITAGVARGAVDEAVTATIPIGEHVWDVDVASSTGRVFISGQDELDLVDGASGRVLRRVAVGSNSSAFDATRDRVYTAASAAGLVTELAAASGDVTATFSVGENPRSLAVDGAAHRLYVLTDAPTALTIVDTVTHAVLARVPLEVTPAQVALAPSGDRVYVTYMISGGIGTTPTGGVLTVDPSSATVISDTPLEAPARGVAFDSRVGKLFVAVSGFAANALAVVDPTSSSVIDRVPVAATAWGVDVNPSSGHVYVTSSDAGALSVVDDATHAVIRTLAVGATPRAVAVDQTSGRVFVGNWDSADVSALGTDAAPPTTAQPTLSVNPKAVAQSSVLSAAASDPGSGIAAGEYFFGSDPGPGNGKPMAVSAGTLSATIGTDVSPGVYTVGVRARDGAGNWSAVADAYLVVYDPTGGYATGGGWIVPGSASSDAGDLLPGLDGTSRANFGFVVKYASGASTVPGGSLQFTYSAGSLRLHSTAMDWLVVTNENWAKFQGSATIDGRSGVYPFRLAARDGDTAGGTQSDRLALSIYAPGADPSTAEPIYKASGDVSGQIQIRRG